MLRLYGRDEQYLRRQADNACRRWERDIPERHRTLCLQRDTLSEQLDGLCLVADKTLVLYQELHRAGQPPPFPLGQEPGCREYQRGADLRVYVYPERCVWEYDEADYPCPGQAAGHPGCRYRGQGADVLESDEPFRCQGRAAHDTEGESLPQLLHEILCPAGFYLIGRYALSE